MGHFKIFPFSRNGNLLAALLDCSFFIKYFLADPYPRFNNGTVQLYLPLLLLMLFSSNSAWEESGFFSIHVLKMRYRTIVTTITFIPLSFSFSKNKFLHYSEFLSVKPWDVSNAAHLSFIMSMCYSTNSRCRNIVLPRNDETADDL